MGFDPNLGFRLIKDVESDDISVVHNALKELNSQIDFCWAEVSDALSSLEVLHEDEGFAHRQLVAIVISKVYFHLGEYNEALSFALEAGSFFDTSSHSEFIDTILAKCVSEYIVLRQKAAEEGVEGKIKAEMTNIMTQMFNQCIKDKQYTHGIGIALETRRIEWLEQIITAAKDQDSLLSFTFQAARDVLDIKEFRLEVFRLLVKVHLNQPIVKYDAVCDLLIECDDGDKLVEIILLLIKKDQDGYRMALQACFDLEANARQELVAHVRFELSEKALDASESFVPQFCRLNEVLTGELRSKFGVEYLYSNNKSDIKIINELKALPRGNSLCHWAIVFSHSMLQSGTTCDAFLRINMKWLGKATDWAQYAAVASLSVIHKGHTSEAFKILKPYLPSLSSTNRESFAEAGALCGLGLIHAGQSENVHDFLLEALRNAGTDETIQHGACMGIGIAGMGSASPESYEAVRTILHSDSANGGEAAGLAIGLIHLGKAPAEVVSETLAYARDTLHEKIVRSSALGLSFTVMGCEEGGDSLIETLTSEKDPILRYGGAYSIGLSYVGTSSSSAVRRLLHLAVSDASDDVRRAAVTSLSFVLFRNPGRLCDVVRLLSESFNPNVRYGTVMAIGIGCCGTALPAAIDILKPLLKDPVDIVRQATYLAMAMVCINASEDLKQVAEVKKELTSAIKASSKDGVLPRMGLYMALGIFNAGGGNQTLSMKTRTGAVNMEAVVGMVLFAQWWFWHPNAYFLSMALTPAANAHVLFDDDFKVKFDGVLDQSKAFSVLVKSKESVDTKDFTSLKELSTDSVGAPMEGNATEQEAVNMPAEFDYFTENE